MNTAFEETFIRQAKRQKRCVSPDREEDYSSIGCAEEYLTNSDHVDDANDEERNYLLHETEQKLCETILADLEDLEEESLMKQSRMRTNLKQRRKNPSSRQAALANEKLKCGISKVLALILQSPTLLGRLDKERMKSLLHIERLIERNWDLVIEDFVCEFRAVLRHCFQFPPRSVYVSAENSIAEPSLRKPKQLCFDVSLRQNKLIKSSRSVLESLSKSTQDLLRQRLESLGHGDNLTTAPLENTEGLHDILHVWTVILQRTSCTADEEALELYQDALREVRFTSIDSMLWNFAYYLSLNE